MDRRLLLVIASCGPTAVSVLLWLQAAPAINNVWVVLCLLSVQQAFYAVNSPTRAAAVGQHGARSRVRAHRVADDDKV